MRRAVVFVLALACSTQETPRPQASPPAPIPEAPSNPRPTEPAPVFAPPLDPATAVPTASAPASIDNKFLVFVYLLTVDVYLAEILDRYPGAPTGTRYNSFTYRWPLPDEGLRAKMRDTIDMASGYAGQGATSDVDTLVTEYTGVVKAGLPAVLSLASYYSGKWYVDDEFARGRTDAPRVKTLRDDLARLRPALWNAVLGAWREAAGDIPDSPRAVIGRSWEACVRVGESVVMHVDERTLDKAVVECRKGVFAVTKLPAPMHDRFDVILRDTAVELGDYAAGSRSEWEIPSEILEVTKAYLDRWPKIPGAPAERATP